MPGQLSGRRRCSNRVAGFFILMAVMGCGGRAASISGKVIYKGQPLTAGYVVVYGEEGRSDSGRIDAEGNYTVYKAPVGNIKVAILTADTSRKPPPGSLAKSKNAVKRPDAELTGLDRIATTIPIPARYKDPEQSGLTFTVKSGSQTIDLELKP